MAGEASLEDWNYIMTTLSLVNREKEFLYYRLKNLPGLIPYPPSANFILVDCWNSGHTAAEICETLEDKGILVRNASNFVGLNEFFFRVAVRQRNENLILLRGLQEILGK
jgi:threonine-phosphate decarboxylase